jgi:hypothetical protein
MNQENFLYSKKQVLQAIFVPSTARYDGIKFLTTPENDLQIALMTRDLNSPVHAHKHLLSERNVHSTQEFVWIREGKAQVTIYDDNHAISHQLILSTDDSILFVSGGHAINFLISTQILEIKQGPYLEIKDKVYLRSES